MAEHWITQKQEVDKEIHRLGRQTNQLSWLRLLVFFIAFAAVVLGIVDHNRIAGVLGAVAVLLFFTLVFFFQRIQEKWYYSQAMGTVLERYIARFSDDWKSFPDTGEEFLADREAKYREAALDLDLFGRASLFQYLNTAVSSGGRERLAKWLVCQLCGSSDAEWEPDAILERQQAVQELNEREDFSLRLEALSQKQRKGQALSQFVVPQADAIAAETRKASVMGMMALLSVLGMAVVFVLAVVGRIGYGPVGIWLVLQWVISQAVDGMISEKSAGAFSCLKYLSGYREYLETLSSEPVASSLLKKVKREVQQDSARAMKRLERIGEALQFRHNPIVYGLLCMVCFYNIFVYVAFVRWNQQYSERIPAWVDAVSETEALLSLAVIGRVHNTVCYPELEREIRPYAALQCMRHPLLQERSCVGNDVVLDNQIRIITGSNMSGKTTYLRTLGINLVLAYAGAPVCAEMCRVSQMQIFTSMRVVDDVGEGISTFYAEVLRIQKMVVYSQSKRAMLVLIDEIFKGTNSADRIIGAQGVLRALCQDWVAGMVSTHDFELCRLEEELPKLQNYHFDEYFEGEQLRFAYQIKQGRCTTTNALHILKMAGIDVN